MNNWYDPGKRHYGRKPNSRRERGIKRKDTGKSHKVKQFDVKMPAHTTKKFMIICFSIYSTYCKMFEKYMNEDVAYFYTLKYSRKANHSLKRIKLAIKRVEEFKRLNNIQ